MMNFKIVYSNGKKNTFSSVSVEEAIKHRKDKNEYILYVFNQISNLYVQCYQSQILTN